MSRIARAPTDQWFPGMVEEHLCGSEQKFILQYVSLNFYYRDKNQALMGQARHQQTTLKVQISCSVNPLLVM